MAACVLGTITLQWHGRGARALHAPLGALGGGATAARGSGRGAPTARSAKSVERATVALESTVGAGACPGGWSLVGQQCFSKARKTSELVTGRVVPAALLHIAVHGTVAQ